jgi:hypothetical protein
VQEDDDKPRLAAHLDDLRLPQDFADRPVPADLARVTAFMQHHDRQVQQENRNFHVALMMSFISVVEEACQRLSVASAPTVLVEYPPLETMGGGRRRNSLTLPVPEGRPISLRTRYDRAQALIKFKLARRGYPSEAPHATQAWQQHRDELESLFAFSPEERAEVMRRLWTRVLAMPKPAYRTADMARRRPFVTLLSEFPSAPREPGGVVLQALAYAFYNVDMRHLTAVEADKVRAGGARTGNVGDIDGWDASELVQTVEVKDLDLTHENEHELQGFLANLVDWPDATAIVVARSFDDHVSASLRAQFVHMATRDQLIAAVAAWDMERQRAAIRAMDYFVVRVQAHDRLSVRYRQFIADLEIELD